MNSDLEAKVSKEETKEVLSSFKKVKIHGNNGWSIEGYLGFYDLMIDGLQTMVEEFRNSRIVMGTINSTFIALIPKG
jgi:hypothetical protein